MRAAARKAARILVALAAVWPCGALRADTLVVHEYAVTATGAWETFPRLGNDGVSDLVTFTRQEVLPDGTLGKGDIFYQRLAGGAPSGAAVQVTSDAQDNQLADVSGDYIVYTAYDSTSTLTGRVMLYRISTGQLYAIGSALVMLEPRIHGNKVVWREGGANATMVMIYDLAWLGTARSADVLAGPIPPSYGVDIGDRFVVWAEDTLGQRNIMAYDLVFGIRVAVTATPSIESEPSTSGAWLVWQEQDKGSSGTRILARNLDTAEERVIADLVLGVGNYRPSISGDLVAWESTRNGNRDVFVYRLSTRETFQVTSGPLDEYLVDLFGRSIAHVEQRTGTDDIYVSDLTFVSSLPPIADAGAPQNANVGDAVTLQGTATDPNVPPLPIASWQWTVTTSPAGSTWQLAGETTATATFTPAAEGAYVLSLVAGNGYVLSAPSFVTVNVASWLPPVAVATADATGGVAPLAVCFDAGGSYSPQGGALQFAWTFGDGGTAATPQACHVYSASVAPYEATVTVTDARGMTDTEIFAITVEEPNRAPTASPTASPNRGTAPLTVQLAANASDPDGDPLTYSWSFGDGGTSADPSPTHVFATPGTYTVWLSVSDGRLSVSASLTVAVDSPITLDVRMAAVKWWRHRTTGMVTVWADFTAPVPGPDDLILVSFDGIQLVAAPLSAFRYDAEDGVYVLAHKGHVARLDFVKHRLFVLTPKIALSRLDDANGVDVELMIGSAVAVQNVKLEPVGKERLLYRRPGCERDY